MGAMESKQIVLKGLAARYYFVQPKAVGPHPPVLFLHGWRSEGKVWQETMLWLGERGIASFALDLPGFGGSEAPREAWNVGDYCQAVDEFVKKMGMARMILVGHSFGGRIAIKLCSENPEYISKLVLVGSHGFRDRSAGRKVKVAMAKIAKPFFVLPPLAPLRKKIYSWMGAEDYVATPALRSTFVNVINEDLEDYIAAIRQPACLIWGSEDKMTPVSFGQRMAALIPGSRLWVIPGAGHYSFLDQPEEFREILFSFI